MTHGSMPFSIRVRTPLACGDTSNTSAVSISGGTSSTWGRPASPVVR